MASGDTRQVHVRNWEGALGYGHLSAEKCAGAEVSGLMVDVVIVGARLPACPDSREPVLPKCCRLRRGRARFLPRSAIIHDFLVQPMELAMPTPYRVCTA